MAGKLDYEHIRFNKVYNISFSLVYYWLVF